MVNIKWTLELLVDLFAQRGHKLLSEEYAGVRMKYSYQCKCGNSLCSITIGGLKEGKNNCKSCSVRKRKTTNLQKFGTEHSFQNAEVKGKIKATNINNLGCEYPTQNADVKEKINATNISNLGCENP